MILTGNACLVCNFLSDVGNLESLCSDVDYGKTTAFSSFKCLYVCPPILEA